MAWASSRARYPELRHRRRRAHQWIREAVAETILSPSDLIYPVFVHEFDTEVDVPSMPGVKRYSIMGLQEMSRRAADLGITGLAVFPVVDARDKSEDARAAYDENNLVCRSVRSIKELGLDLGIICDVALDPFTSHGQDGLMKDGQILNDETVKVLTKQAVAQANAGCDVIAPSDMMDGRIGEIRRALDNNGHQNTLILSYAAKYASSYYGPFRDAVGSKTSLGKADKRTYQMDPRNTDEALREVASDLDEGADMVMVKPGLPYLDIVRRVKDTFLVPTAVYQVSGEYSMLHAAAQQGWLEYESTMRESLISLKRAGADMILTYAALEAAGWFS
ncbi:MAG: porphobilinogen synthase [Myxococcota bacterium]|nr:porphobilinogen synthase [Myxococcota bacterium]